jgi:hypothetical protein
MQRLCASCRRPLEHDHHWRFCLGCLGSGKDKAEFIVSLVLNLKPVNAKPAAAEGEGGEREEAE